MLPRVPALLQTLRYLPSASKRRFSVLCDRPELLFAGLAMLFGVGLVLAIPPFMVPDEDAHFYHAYQLSEGKLFSSVQHVATGSVLPSSLPQTVTVLRQAAQNGGPETSIPYHRYLTARLDQTKTQFVAFDTTAVYSPVAYVPQVLGIVVAKVIYPTPLFLMYAGRLGNLMAFIVLAYLAIRIVPVKKWLFVTIGLMPMALQQSASLSSDALNLGICMLAVAYCIYLAARQSSLSGRDSILLLLITLVLGLTKQTNALVALPFLFLPKVCYGTVRRRTLISASILAAAFGSAIVWYGLTKLLHYNFDYSGNPAVSMAGQIHTMIHAPLIYVKAMIDSYVYDFGSGDQITDFYWISAAGYFSWFTYKLPIPNILLVYIGLLIGIISSTPSTIRAEQVLARLRLFRASVLTTYVMLMVATGTLLYLVWSPVGALSISGVQGRYFLPFIPLLALIYIGRQSILKSNLAVGTVTTTIVSANFLVMLALTVHYFNLFGLG